MSSFTTNNVILNATVNAAQKNSGIPKGDKIELSRDNLRFNPDFRVTFVKGMYRISINSQYVCTHANAATAFTTAVEKYLHAQTGK